MYITIAHIRFVGFFRLNIDEFQAIPVNFLQNSAGERLSDGQRRHFSCIGSLGAPQEE